MFWTLMIYEVYTNTEITPVYEHSRQKLTNTQIYRNATQEEKILFEEYIELDELVGSYFYKMAEVNKYVNVNNTEQIIQIVFVDESVFLNFLQQPEYNAMYYEYLTGEVWVNMFGVKQDIIYYKDENQPAHFIDFESALQNFEIAKKEISKQLNDTNKN